MRVALTMIVKNEAHVIERCLASVISYVDAVVVHDTGSTDGTQGLIRDFCKMCETPCMVLDTPWKDFATNRSAVMRTARDLVPEFLGGIGCDYGFTIDADNVFVSDLTREEFHVQLTTDLVEVMVHTNGHVHNFPLIYSLELPFKYRGVLHEFLDMSPAKTRRVLKGGYSNQIQDSARNKNPRKYEDDVDTLLKAIETETEVPMLTRLQFYLAQSYRDAKQYENAITAYAKRASMGGWDQEVAYSYLMVARLVLQRTEGDPDVNRVGAIDALMASYQACPQRVEAVHELARIHRLAGEYHLAFIFARQAIEIHMPEYPLFTRPSVYQWEAIEEYVLACYYTGRMAEAKRWCNQLIERSLEIDIPQDAKTRFFTTLQYINTEIQKQQKP